MDNIVVWIIIIAFYAPLHFLLPILVVFIVGKETEVSNKDTIKKVLLDALGSLVAAFTFAILLVSQDLMQWAMLVLILSMPFPFIRVIKNIRGS